MMDRILESLKKNPALVFGVIFAIILVVLYIVSTYRISGTVSATVIGTDGSTRAVSFNLKSIDQTRYYSFSQDVRRVLIAAVPAPGESQTAFVTREKGGEKELSIGDAEGRSTRVVSVGEVSDPRWSPEGTSIAFAKHDASEEMISPESWVVKRAVAQGDSLVVGRGYEPYPSPNQRTFALTSRGIALLAYNDTDPTIVIASPTPVPLTTPFTVSQDGMRIAWVAPADKSLQVFENENGYFVPLLLSKDFTPQTMTFSPDGRYLLGTTHTEATTTLSVVTVASGKVRALADIPGFVRLHTWNYEK